MMDESALRRFIGQEIKRQMNIILSGAAANASNTNEDIQGMFPGMTGITQRPVMHPYGYCSKAPDETISVTARQGDHAGNRVVLGHRSADRPSDLAEGESVIYSLGQYRVKVTNTGLFVSKGTDYEPVVVGETLRQFLIGLMQQLQIEQHLGNLGFQTSYPLNASQYEQLEAQNLDNKKILAEDGGRY